MKIPKNFVLISYVVGVTVVFGVGILYSIPSSEKYSKTDNSQIAASYEQLTVLTAFPDGGLEEEVIEDNNKEILAKEETEPEDDLKNIGCTKEYNPVCGVDGNTYSNRCLAEEFYNISVDYGGSCTVLVEEEIESTPVILSQEVTESLTCSFVYEPVCGENSKTYSNACFAGLDGVSVASSGICSDEQVASQNTESSTEIEVTSTEPLPELHIKAASHYGAQLFEGNILSFSAVVENNGNSAADTSFSVSFSIDKDNDGTTDIIFAERETGLLKQGETETVIWYNAFVLIPGTHKANICADSTSVVPELDENNNCKSFIFTVSLFDPDLSVDSLFFYPTSPTAGDTLNLSGNIKNIGEGDADISSARLRVDLLNDGKGKWDIEVSLLTKALKSGESVLQEWLSVTPAVGGSIKFEICADYENQIDESEELNNCRTEIFQVTHGTYIGSSNIEFVIENGAISPSSQSVSPSGTIVLINKDSSGHSVIGEGIGGSSYIDSNTQIITKAPMFLGTYTFGIGTLPQQFQGTVIVE